MMDEGDSSCIIDRYFYAIYKKMSEKVSKRMWYYGVRAFMLAIAIPTNHFILEEDKNQKVSLLTIFFLLAFSVSSLQIILSSYMHFAKVRNKEKIIKIAVELHHSKQIESLKSIEREDYEQLADLYEIQDKMGFKVSISYYDFENMEKVNDVSAQFKLIRESTGENTIRVALQSDMKVYKIIQKLLKLGSAAIIIFGFVVGSLSTINEAQHSLLQIVLISEVIINPKVFTILTIICLVPAIVVLLILYLCCCKKGLPKAKLPAKVKVTPQSLSKCADCSICFQDYVIDQDIIVLPCANSHIFHETCIENWTKVKPNCPICRKQLCQ